jgi:hypothetical protein
MDLEHDKIKRLIVALQGRRQPIMLMCNTHEHESCSPPNEAERVLGPV